MNNFEMKTNFCNILNVFNVTFDQYKVSWLNKFFWNSHFALLLSLLNIYIYIYIENYVLFFKNVCCWEMMQLRFTHIIFHNPHAAIYIKSRLINKNMTVSWKKRFIVQNGYIFLTHTYNLLQWYMNWGPDWPNWDFESPPYTGTIWTHREGLFF